MLEEPNYYNQDGLSPLNAFEQGLISREEYVGFLKGNIIKYVVRCDKKGDCVGDLGKAGHYLELLRDVYEGNH